MTSSNLVITVSHQHGTGGRAIAQEVARQLKLPYLDKQIVRVVTEELGIPAEQLADFDEKYFPQLEQLSDLLSEPKPDKKFQIPLSRILARGKNNFSDYDDEGNAAIVIATKPEDDEMRQKAAMHKGYHKLVQTIIKDMAAKGGAVIMGRGSTFLLKDRPHTLRVFIYADHSHRLQRLMQLQKISQQEAEQQIQGSDEQRATFVQHYFQSDWRNPDNYDLILNTSHLTLPDAVTAVVQLGRKVVSRPEQSHPAIHSTYERLKQDSYSIEEAAELLWISPNVIAQAIYSGQLKAPLVDHRVHNISREALLDWLHQYR